MKELAAELNQRMPLVVQNLHTADLEDLFLNVFRTAAMSRGLLHLRQATWRSEKAFNAATAADYVEPDDEILAEVRDECDVRLVVPARGYFASAFCVCQMSRGYHFGRRS